MGFYYHENMKVVVLFWFYKELEVCKNHLELFKKHNPNVQIFGLFGGKEEEASTYKSGLKNYLDDFYVSSLVDKNEDFKWIHGDLMLLDWFENKGKDLNWDSVVILQWDVLVFDSLEKQFSNLKKDEIFLSGLRELDAEIELLWSWTKPEGENRVNYLAFREYIEKEYNYNPVTFLCSLFILEVFPRVFFEKWGMVKNKKIGMLEYKIPAYADIFKVPFYKKELGVWWFNKDAHEGNAPMNARGVEINKDFILSELNKKDGFRIFHPYFKQWDL
jgi:hypothetical protein